MTRKKKTPKQFLTELASDPEKLGKFIKDPDKVLAAEGIPLKDRVHIKNAMAHKIFGRLTSTPDAYVVLF